MNDEGSNQVWMFGRHMNNQQAKLIYSTTLWFTYRDNLIFEQSPLSSDVGWGCMPRVGQMMIAQALRNEAGLELFNNQQIILRTIDSIIRKEESYSLQKIVAAGKQVYKKLPGDWYSPCQIAFILKQLHNQNGKSLMRIAIFHNEFESSSLLQYLSVRHKDKTQQVTTTQMKKKKKEKIHEQQVVIHPGLVIILIRIGLNSPQPEMIKSLVRVMKLPAFIGILGGRPGKAHYIIGTTEKSFIYLDPHVVKDKNQAQEFFSTTMFSMAHEKIDPSMGVCLFIKDYAQFVFLSDQLKSLKDNSTFYSYSVIPEPLIVELQQPAEILQ